MCCGQPTRRLDDAGCVSLAARVRNGERKQLLCTTLRIGNAEFDRALARGVVLEALSRAEKANGDVAGVQRIEYAG